MSKFELRPYQKEAISAVLTARKRGVQRLLLCLPTGAGKTVIFAHLAQMARRGVLVLAHRSELLLQAQEKIQRGLPPEIQVAIEAGEQKAPAEAKIVLCSIRSLREERLQQLLQGRDIGLVIYDECHHATAEDNLRVLTQIGVFQKQWQGTLLGVTATTSRADGIGLGRVFEEIVYSRSLTQMVEEGYLAPLKGYRITTQTPLPALSDQGQDFDPEELAEVVDVEDRNALIARTLQEFARDRRILVFCVNVNHAFHLSKALNHLSIPTKTVHGMMPALERADTLKRFAIANLQAITNVAVLTEGFDDPGVSCIAMARPTRSSALYLQCIGRGMRLAPGKKECIILDFVDLSLLEIVTLPTLFGMPRHLKLQGEDVLEAEKTFRKFLFDYPGFEIEAGEITLETLQKNAAQFNPLTLEVQEDVLALSLNAWISLGSRGLVLHFYRKKNELSTFSILAQKPKTGKKYNVFLNEQLKARFSHIEEAVEAVDYEIQKMGTLAIQTALPTAPWRRGEVPHPLEEQLAQLKPPRSARTLGEALHYLSFAQRTLNHSVHKK